MAQKDYSSIFLLLGILKSVFLSLAYVIDIFSSVGIYVLYCHNGTIETKHNMAISFFSMVWYDI